MNFYLNSPLWLVAATLDSQLKSDLHKAGHMTGAHSHFEEKSSQGLTFSSSWQREQQAMCSMWLCPSVRVPLPAQLALLRFVALPVTAPRHVHIPLCQRQFICRHGGLLGVSGHGVALQSTCLGLHGLCREKLTSPSHNVF